MIHTLHTLLAALSAYGLTPPQTAPPVAVQAVTSDSRQVEPGTLFVAIRGASADGHRFLADAARRGAAAALGALSPVELADQGLALPGNLPYITVTDARLALAVCAAALHDFPSRALTVIGVTGTDGKTTTASLLEAILTADRPEPPTGGGAVGDHHRRRPHRRR
jgi:UDP-N-acetylmuramoyl-L-alanyl-D-glutamate--2,6-diaminopimelate ligase